jgi:integrase
MQALSKPELLKLLGAAKAANGRDWLMMAIAFNHGLRVSEVLAITPDDIRDEILTVRRLKGSRVTRQRLVQHRNPLLSEAAPLFDLCRRTPRKSKLFKMHRSTAWRHIMRHAQVAGIGSASVRALKHTLATLTITKAGVKAVQLQLGHVNAQNTLIYTDMLPAEASERVRKAL